MRILIVDDDAKAAKVLVGLLRELGHRETRVARSAATALPTAIAFDPAFVFMDVELPDMSAYDAALRIHEHPKIRARLAPRTRSTAI